jgi:hypothetical protein
MTVPKNAAKGTRLVACGAFRQAVEYLDLARRVPDLSVTYLPSNLHIRPRKLGERLARRIAVARKECERVICLYGDCFPGIGAYCEQRGVLKVPGFHCYGILLGSEEFDRLIEETAGTYFLERDLIMNFEEYCAQPLELHDEAIRTWCFEHYQRVVYVHQPLDPELTSEAGEIARFLGLSFEVRDADYTQLDRKLMELIETE